MYLRNHFNLYFFICFLCVNTVSFALADSTSRHQSPYRTEPNPWYKLTTFQRGFDSDSVRSNLDTLEAKPRKNWTRIDSLHFAETLLQTGSTDVSAYYFLYLKPDFYDEEKYWWDESVNYILNEEYPEGIERIYESSPGILKFSKIYFLDQFLKAYIAHNKDNKWYKTHKILNFPVDSSLIGIDKTGERYQNEVIIPLENLDFVLKLLIHHIHKDDPIIASACHEMGQIFEYHMALSDAYIAYSIGRHYNKWDKEILNSLKIVKSKLSNKKYKIPIFTRYFPLTEHWRFEYEVLKEKIAQNKDTTVQEIPSLMLPPTEDPLPVSGELIILSGIFVLFLFILFFVKSKK